MLSLLPAVDIHSNRGTVDGSLVLNDCIRYWSSHSPFRFKSSKEQDRAQKWDDEELGILYDYFSENLHNNVCIYILFALCSVWSLANFFPRRILQWSLV